MMNRDLIWMGSLGQRGSSSLYPGTQEETAKAPETREDRGDRSTLMEPQDSNPGTGPGNWS